MSKASQLMIDQIRNKKKDAQIAIDQEFQELLAESEQSTKIAVQQRQKRLLDVIDQSDKLIAQKVALMQQQRIEQVKEFNSSADTFMELKAGGVDAVVNDRPVNDYYIVKSGETGVRSLNELLSSEDYGMAMIGIAVEVGVFLMTTICLFAVFLHRANKRK